MVRCRAGASRGPPMSRGSRCSSRASKAAGGRASPGRRPVRSPAGTRPGGGRSQPRPRVVRVTAKLGKTEHASGQGNNSTAADCSMAWRPASLSGLPYHPEFRHRVVFALWRGAAVAPGDSCSPDSRSGARLVASTVSWGQAVEQRGDKEVNLPPGCARRRISSTSNPSRAEGQESKPLAASCAPPLHARQKYFAMVEYDQVRITQQSQTNDSDSIGERASVSRAATAIATRVLPTPPGPVRVSSRMPRVREAVCHRSSQLLAPRPTSVVSGCGGPEKGTASRTSNCTGGDPLRVTTARLDALLSMACAAAVSRAGHTITAFPQPGDSTSVAHWASDQRWTTTRLSSERLRA